MTKRLFASCVILVVSSLLISPAQSSEGDIKHKDSEAVGLRDERTLVDTPNEAAEFFRSKRVPVGQNELPVERYLSALYHVKRMPSYSTALRASRYNKKATHFNTESSALGTWSPLGPGNVGGRTRGLLINPRNPSVMYAAGVTGGIWSSTNAGSSWSASNDMLATLNVCSLAMDPSDPKTIYAGTGEIFVGFRGAGIFKTTDGGTSWTQLDSTRNPDFYYVSSVVISPNNNQHVYAATASGVWRSLDAGGTWIQVLPTGPCVDLVMRTDQPNDYVLASCGFSSSNISVNTDAAGSGTWEQVLAEPNMGRTSLAIAPSNQNVIYALAASTESGLYDRGLLGVFRSTDGGHTWAAQDRNTNGIKLYTSLLSSLSTVCSGSGYNQGTYDNVIAVDPVNPDRVWAGGINLFRSDDAGVTWGITLGTATANIHEDHHAIVFHPQYNATTNKTVFVTNDGGIYKTDNPDGAIKGPSDACNFHFDEIKWTSLNNSYATTQFYYGTPYPDGKSYLAGSQDNGLWGGSDADGSNNWHLLSGGDCGFVAIDPTDTNIVYSGFQTHQSPYFFKTTDGMHTAMAINGITEPGTGFLFLPPFVMDPNNSRILWTGGHTLWRTTDGASNWTPASPAAAAGSVSALAVAPGNSNIVLAGMSDGTIRRTDAGLTATPDTPWPSSQPRVGFVSCVAFDPANNKTAYATYSSFDSSPTDRHLYKSDDGGATWTAIDGTGQLGIPDIPVHSILVDPADSMRLYLGTDLGVFVSTDGGGTWATETTGFANVITESLAINNAGSNQSLFAFTFGRGAWRVRLSGHDPSITSASVDGKRLTVMGQYFDNGATILVNDKPQATVNDRQNPSTVLIAKKGAKKIPPGVPVTLQVRNSNGTLSPEFSFTRPAS